MMIAQGLFLNMHCSAQMAARSTVRTFMLAVALVTSVHSQQPPPSVYYSVPSWSPDGKTIAFESNRDGEAAVYTIRPDGTGLRRLTPVGSPGEQPNWSANGRQIVFTSSGDGERQLYLMNLEGGDVVAVPNTRNGFLAAFSPDGQWLLFATQDTIPSMLYRIVIMHPDGSSRRTLGDSGKSNEGPQWTVDGSRVVFTQVPVLERLPIETPREFIRRRDAAQTLLSVCPDSSDLRVHQPEVLGQITRDRGLSPDGKWMVYGKTLEGVSGLYIQERASGTERLLDRGVRDR